MSIYSYSLQGRRPSNEDQHTSILNINNNIEKYASVNYFGVYDGHGGKLVSKFLKNNLHKYFTSKKIQNIKEMNNKSISEYIYKVFNKVQSKLEKEHPIAVNHCGSTAVSVLNYKDKNNDNILWVMNAGDSRALLCNYQDKAIQLSFDHKPNVKNERERILGLGGKPSFDGLDWRISGLSLSRSFGDLDARPYITHKPEIHKYKINKTDKFLVLACDGLWDVLSNQIVVKYINNLKNKNFKGNYSKSLAEYAYKKGSYDNISVLVYFFN